MNTKNEQYNPPQIQACCSASDCCPPAGSGRRSFIKTAGLSAAALLTSHAEIMAGPFDPKVANDFDKVIPADKRLSKQWIEGLYARGEALTATGESLNNIGMPITGLGTGQIYLSGDGRLWNWNLTAKKGKKHNPKGPSYADPDQAKPSDWQGFAIRVGDKIRTLDSTGFQKVRFTNRYPMALVDFTDDNCPVDVRLEAYTPFIPLNRDESSYPVIVMRYTLTNTDATSQEISIAGWIENRLNGPKAPKINVFQESDKIGTVKCVGKDTNSQSLAVGLLGPDRPDFVNLTKRQPGVADIFADASVENGQREKAEPEQRSFASLGRTITLQPGKSETVTFTVSFRIPNVRYGTAFGNNKKSTTPGRYHYATLWSTASESAGQFADRETSLYENSKKWTDTWYDSTLPYWFLERAFIPIDCMQTQVAQRVYPPEGTQDIYNLEEGVRCGNLILHPTWGRSVKR